MTREEFDDIRYFYQLVDACQEYDLHYLDDYIDGEDLDGEVDYDIGCGNYSWDTLRDNLNQIETGYDFYRRDGAFDYVPCDAEDLESLKAEIARCIEQLGGFDEDDDEDTYERPKDAYEEPRIEVVHMDDVWFGEQEPA